MPPISAHDASILATLTQVPTDHDQRQQLQGDVDELLESLSENAKPIGLAILGETPVEATGDVQETADAIRHWADHAASSR